MKRKACSHSDEFLGEVMGHTSIRIKKFNGGIAGDMERWNDANMPEGTGSIEYHTISNSAPDESFSPR